MSWIEGVIEGGLSAADHAFEKKRSKHGGRVIRSRLGDEINTQTPIGSCTSKVEE